MSDERYSYRALGVQGIRTDAGLVVPVPVRWSDMDVYQHVNNARMLTLIEEARTPLLFGDDAPTERLAEGLVLVETHIYYRGQLRHQDSPLQVTMWLSGLRAVEFTVHHEVRALGADPASAPAVVATCRLASFDVAAGRPRRFESEEREYLRELVREPAEK